MTKEQFISLLRTPSTINLNMVRGLEEITERFPYFQNAHLLLAKQYQGHQNIRYESYLRKAAAYASDRRVLYDLIKLEPQEVIHIEPESEGVTEKVREGVRNVGPEAEVVRGKVMEEVRSIEPLAEDVREEVRNDEPRAEVVMEGVRNDEPRAEVVMEEVRNDEPRAEVVMEEVRNDEPQAEVVMEEVRNVGPEAEVVRGKVMEEVKEEVRNVGPEAEDVRGKVIEEVKEEVRNVRPEAEVVREEVRDVVDDEVKNADVDSIALKDAIELPEKSTVTDPQEIIAKRLRELAKSKEEVVAASIKSPENQPVSKTSPIVPTASQTEEEPNNEEPAEPEFVRVRREQREPREPRDPKLKVEEQHSFLEWLKLKDIPVIPTERVSEYFKKEDVADGDLHKPGEQLIDRFIKTEPRIVPARSEFYSPGNMARQSAVDHEDLISETLARIYAQQGNIPKAIDAYKRLSLKIPEKSSYFAALIKDLEQKEQS